MRLRSHPRRVPKRSGYPVKAVTPAERARILARTSRAEPVRIPRPRRPTLPRANAVPVIDSDRRVAGRHPAGRGRHGRERVSIADLSDPGMLDVVGLDTATLQLISDFARGAL